MNTPSNLLFIDSTVDDKESLIAGAVAGTPVIIIDPLRDGISQITEVLAQHTGISTLHIVSHGSPGSLQLGNTNLSLNNLDRYTKKLQSWTKNFSCASIILYGCEVAAGAVGQAFVQKLSQLTGTEVAASTNKTGSAALGGDWEMEYSTGKVNIFLAFDASVLASYSFVLASFGSATSFGAQTPPNGGGKPQYVSVDDLNGDGFLDLVIPNRVGNVSIFLGDGTGKFGTATNFNTGQYAFASDIGDFNRDNIPDIAVANWGSSNVSILLGTGGGNFNPATNFAVGLSPWSVTTGDFNQDSYLDFATANTDANTVSIVLGNGTGSFGAATDFAVGSRPQSVAAGDFNADGFLDFATANYNSNDVSIVFGTGGGNFGTPTNIGVGTNPYSVAVADLNGDSILDLATANEGSSTVSVLLGTGGGNFNPATNFNVGPNPRSVAVSDFNVDGKLDLVTANGVISNSPTDNISILSGDGTGNFEPASNLSIGTGPWTAAVGDFNADGLPDLATSNYWINTTSVLLNTTTPVASFGSPTNFGAGNQPQYVSVDDLNGDGILDLVIPNRATNNVSLLLGDGTGKFGTATNFNTGLYAFASDIGDFNSDNIPDIAVANWGSSNVSILLGTGGGNFNPATNYSVGSSPWSVTTGDFNQDSYLDFATANTSANTVSIVLGNGTGSFGSATNFAVGSTPQSVAAGDFNADGILDFVTANYSSNNVSIVLGTGGGNFGTATNIGVGTNPYSVTVADLNGDNILDLATANEGSSTVSVLVGTGGGNFNAATNFSVGPGPRSVTTGDFNVDGFLDLVTANGVGSNSPTDNISILSGDGTGNFGPARNLSIGTGPWTAAVGDFNTDGLPDLATSNYWSGNSSVLLNTTTIHANNVINYAITANNATVTEGNTGTTPITYTITRSGRTNVASSVDLSFDGTATNNTDYTLAAVAGTGITNTANTVNFAAGATSATITLNVAGDVVSETNETIQVSLTPSTTPAGVQATVPITTPVSTTITNDDTAGFTITPAGVTLNTTEAGGTASFTIRLNTQPTSDVTLALSSSKTAEGAVTPSVIFNSTNWNTPQTITLTAVNDNVADGNVAYQINGTVSSSDTNYSALTFPSVNASNTDNDIAGVTIVQSNGSTSVAEGGATDSYTIALNTIPSGIVDITAVANSQTQISTDGITFVNSATFTRTNTSPQTITVRAINDNVVEGNHTDTITHSIRYSTASEYPTTLAINPVTVNITDANQPPTLTNINKPGSEDTAITFTAADFTNAFSDANGDRLTKIKITALPTNGTLTLNGVSVAANQEIAGSALGGLAFTPSANFNGNVSFGWNGFDGTTYATSSAQVNLNIAPVNDAPTVSNISKAANEDTLISLNASDFISAFSDADANSLTKIKITTLPTNGTLTLNGVAVTANQEINLASLANLSFTPSANFNGSTSFNWNGFDGTTYAVAGASVSLTINAVNDVPIVSNISKSGNEDTAITFTAADFTNAFSDADGDSLTKIKITALPTNGNLRLNGVSVAPNQEIAVAALGGLSFTPNANFNGNVSFGWNGFDGTSYSASNAEINLIVNPINDLPVVSTISKIGSAGTAITFTATDFQSAFGDLDNDALSKIKIPSLPDNGSLTLNGVAVTANQEIEPAALANLAFTPDADFSGVITFGWNGFDGTAYAAAGANVSLAVDVINTAPTLGNISKAGNENADIAFTAADFTGQFSDADGNPLSKVKITSLPTNGTLKLSGVSVTANQEIEAAALGNLVFSPNANFDGTTGFTWNAFDGIAYATAAASVNITVNNVNNLPIVNTVVKQGNEDTNIGFSATDFTGAFGDLDGDSLAKIKLTSLPQNGTLNLAGNRVTVNQEIAVAAINNLTFTPTTNSNGTVSFNWNGSDGTAYAATGNTVNLNIKPVNDAPQQIIDLNRSYRSSGIPIKNVFTDPDGDLLTYNLTLANGGSIKSSPNSSWLNFDFNSQENSITLTGTPPTQWNSFFVNLTATDPWGASANHRFEIRKSQSYTSGWVIDNYISGATVVLDANTNGIVDANEPSATTNTNGEFNLDIPFETFDTNNNGEIDPEEGRLGAFGGTDTATGLPLETPLTAPASATVITLLTTLIQDLIEQGIEPDEANTQVLTALSVPSDIDLTSFDPILATNNNQAGGVEVLVAMTQVQNVITQTNALIDGASSAENSAIMKAVVAAFTTQIKAGTTLDLSSAEQLATLIQQAVTNVKQTDANLNPIVDTQFIASVAEVMAQSNQAIDKAVANSTGESVDEEIARVQKVTLDEVVKDIREAGAGTKEISQVVAEDTGAALDAQIQGIPIDDNDGGNNNGNNGGNNNGGNNGVPVIIGTTDLVNTSFDQTFGSDGDDTLTGTSGDDAISAKQGNDSIVGNDGNDLLFGNQGDDFIDGNAGDDTLYGGKNNDTLLGSGGKDQLLGNLGNDSLNGGDADDYLNGNQGDDTLDGGEGNDSLHGGKDSDILSGNTGDDIVCGDMGSDNLAGNEGNDLLFGNAGSDNLNGGEGNDSLHGGKDDDTLTGGNGNDILNGDMGNDTLIGGAGSDLFVLKSGAGSDTITDFIDGEDLLGLSAGLTFENLTIIAGNNATLISAGDELLATLNGLQPGLITVNDFVQL
ncbi:FG-GAP-like repeat-containing protein [Microcoleus sp. FACHB-68]|uniref:FG-GAP-like repeat-containing protein n=1 Tax=Microcoleus sp. FACHB-68 TaxID=2692826 RepID=UPI00168643C5|nr:FG-GAP-like repeat-containing protein [Microcoleus sp. FACHB-68]